MTQLPKDKKMKRRFIRLAFISTLAFIVSNGREELNFDYQSFTLGAILACALFEVYFLIKQRLNLDYGDVA
jgi:hypothetical protein